MPIDGVSFHSEENVLRWKYFLQRHISDEKVLSEQTTGCLEIMELIHHAGLIKTAVNVGSFYPQLIRELIVNLPTRFNDPSSPDF